MGDPTAIYSSVGAEYDTDGTFDVSFGLAFGRHLLLVETKEGMDSLSATYANMTQGSGFYAEMTFNQANRKLRQVIYTHVTSCCALSLII